MATCYFQRTVFKRDGGKAGAAQRVHYIMREGVYAPAEARVHHLDLQPGGERLRDDLIHTKAQNLPAWAKGDPAVFFTAAETYERANGVAYTEWKFSLPRELSREQQLEAARDLLRTHFGDKHPYVWAMHEPRAADGGTNPHVHAIWSSRTLDTIERTPAQFFKRYNADHPERGGAQKSPLLTAFGEAKRERVAYTDVMNIHLERAGHEVRLHPGSLVARGLDRAPEPRVLPSDSNKAKFQHEVTESWAKVLDSRAQRQVHASQELDNARAYWEHRKGELGLTSTMTLDEARERITHAMQQEAMAPQKQRAQPDQRSRHKLQQDLAQLTQFSQELHAEGMALRGYERRGLEPPAATRDRADALLKHAVALGIEDERHIGHGLDGPRLHDRTREGGLDIGDR